VYVNIYVNRNLVQNLAKSMKFGREFALRSCIRIRATGNAVRTNTATANTPYHQGLENSNSKSSSSEGSLSGTVRFEAVMPNVSFQSVQIKPIPILSTALSQRLTNAKTRTIEAERDLPKMGYLTMNQTRKLVPLLETDPSVPLVPMVGVWVSHAASLGQALGPGGLVDHPFTWAACVRFLCSDHACQKVLLTQDTFLLVRIVLLSSV
jgi:hypothetical protein